MNRLLHRLLYRLLPLRAYLLAVSRLYFLTLALGRGRHTRALEYAYHLPRLLRPGDTAIAFRHDCVREEIPRLFGHALKLRQVSAGGDASCEMELNATGNVNFDFGRYGVDFTASPRHADGVVITGPVSCNMAAALDICYDAVPDPKIIVACGADACSGGLFAESRAVDRSFFERHRVDLWLPGAPTHPMVFIEGIMNLTGRCRR